MPAICAASPNQSATRSWPAILVEARKTLIDQIVEMNDQFLIGMNRRSRSSVEDQRKTLRRRARDGLHRVLGAIDESGRGRWRANRQRLP